MRFEPLSRDMYIRHVAQLFRGGESARYAAHSLASSPLSADQAYLVFVAGRILAKDAAAPAVSSAPNRREYTVLLPKKRQS